MADKKPTVFLDDDGENTKTTEPVEAPVEKKEPPVTAPKENANILQLPSDGAFGYPSYVEYRDIMAGDEEILSSASTDTYAKTLNGVLKGILLNCEYFEQLTLADRDYALIYLWANNYTAVKTITTTCNACEKDTEHKVDLTQLDVDSLRDNFKNGLEIPLKKTGQTMAVRLNTVEDELFVEEFIRKHPKEEYDYDTLMLYRSLDIGVDLSFELKMKWIRENVSAKELGYARKYHTYFRYGVKTVMDYTCKHCGEVARGRIPFQVSDILHPVVQSGFEDLL